MKFTATIHGAAIKISLPQDDPTQPPAEALVVDIGIDCPQCGQHQIRLAGHHLRVIRNLLIEWIDQYPDLCGDEGGIAVAKRLQWSGQPPPDTTTN